MGFFLHIDTSFDLSVLSTSFFPFFFPASCVTLFHHAIMYAGNHSHTEHSKGLVYRRHVDTTKDQQHGRGQDG